IFFMVVNPKNLNVTGDKAFNKTERLRLIKEFEKEYKRSDEDTAILLKKIAVLKDTANPVSQAILNGLEFNDTTVKRPKTFAGYDAAQKALPASKRDGWLTRAI